MFHPAARGFGLCSLLVKIMMVYAVKESGRDSPGEEYLAHVIDGNGAPLHSLLEAGFRPIGPVEVHRGDIDAVIDHMIKGGESSPTSFRRPISRSSSSGCSCDWNTGRALD